MSWFLISSLLCGDDIINVMNCFTGQHLAWACCLLGFCLLHNFKHFLLHQVTYFILHWSTACSSLPYQMLAPLYGFCLLHNFKHFLLHQVTYFILHWSTACSSLPYQMLAPLYGFCLLHNFKHLLLHQVTDFILEHLKRLYGSFMCPHWTQKKKVVSILWYVCVCVWCVCVRQSIFLWSLVTPICCASMQCCSSWMLLAATCFWTLILTGSSCRCPRMWCWMGRLR